MKRIFPLAFLFLCWTACVPEEQSAETTADADTAGEEEIIDTFSVKRPTPLTKAEQAALDSGKTETDDVINDATTIITQSSTPGSDVITTQRALVTNPDVAPSFPGGQPALDVYFKKKLVYPLVAFQNDIKGTVLLKVVIESDGKIGGVSVMKGLGYGCDESAMDCVRKMPNWIPAQKKGVNVRTAVTIPVMFGADIEK